MFLEAAFRRADWFNEKRAVAYPVIFLCVYFFIAALWMLNVPVIPAHDGFEFSRDFVNVYTAGIELHEGDPSAVYDWEGHKAREHRIEVGGSFPNPEEGYVPWLYPPLFLGVAWGLGFLPYYGALALYLTGGFLAYAGAVHRLVRRKAALWAIAAFPGVWLNFFAGQNGLITTALLGGGLCFLDTSPLTAGALFGLLSYKPQFFVLIPLLLAVGRYWRACLASLVSAAVSALASLLAFGVDPWIGFFEGLPRAQQLILESPTERWLGIMHTPFSAVRMFGGSLTSAYAVQVAGAVCAVAFVAFLWSRRPLSLAVRGASLGAALLLVSPYSFNYDQVILAVPLAAMAAEGLRRGFLPYEKIFLCLLWLLPAFAKDYGENYALPLTPFMMLGLLALCWRRMREER